MIKTDKYRDYTRSTGLILYTSWADLGGGGVRTPLFGPRCRLFNIGPQIGHPSGPHFSLLVDLRWTPFNKILDPIYILTHTYIHKYTHTYHIHAHTHIHSCEMAM